jgi:hypothetical protein
MREFVSHMVSETTSHVLAGSNLQVKGVIAGRDTTTHQFRINALTVDYDASSATTTLANGSSVEAQGTSLTSTGELLATRVEVLQGLGAAPSLTVLGVTVTTNAQTHFAGPGGIATGADTFFAQAANHVVKVRGLFSAGVLIADQAQIEQ